jgi:hypothetical protein
VIHNGKLGYPSECAPNLCINGLEISFFPGTVYCVGTNSDPEGLPVSFACAYIGETKCENGRFSVQLERTFYAANDCPFINSACISTGNYIIDYYGAIVEVYEWGPVCCPTEDTTVACGGISPTRVSYQIGDDFGLDFLSCYSEDPAELLASTTACKGGCITCGGEIVPQELSGVSFSVLDASLELIASTLGGLGHPGVIVGNSTVCGALLIESGCCAEDPEDCEVIQIFDSIDEDQNSPIDITLCRCVSTDAEESDQCLQNLTFQDCENRGGTFVPEGCNPFP